MTTAITIESLEEQERNRRREAFANRMLDVLNSAGLALMCSIGHRTGLFDTMAQMPPATSQEIAERAGLNERYVREWLGALVLGRIVEYNPDTKTYHLPADHAAFLTRAAVPNNLCSPMQWVPVLASVEDQIIECFQKGGGVDYSAYRRFHEVMAEESAQSVVAGLEEHIIPLVPGLAEALQAGCDVLDVGCGEAWGMIALAQKYPNSRFAGYDFSAEAIAAGRAKAESLGLSNIRLEVKDAAAIGESARYDLITAFDAIHDQRDPARVLSEIAAALRPDGTFLMQDIHTSSHLHQNMEHPLGPFLFTISCMHCMTVSLAQGGAGLGTCWGEELACEMLARAGFRNVSVHQLPHDILNSYYVARL